MTQDDESYWFKPRRCGYGARPTNWKGWVSSFAVMVGLLVVVRFLIVPISGGAPNPNWEVYLGSAIVIALIVGFSWFARTRTDGEWRWRWGERE